MNRAIFSIFMGDICDHQSTPDKHFKPGSAKIYTELFDNILAKDFLKFKDLKPYEERLEIARKKKTKEDTSSLIDQMQTVSDSLKKFVLILIKNSIFKLNFINTPFSIICRFE